MEAACRYYGKDQADRELSDLSACIILYVQGGPAKVKPTIIFE